MFEYRDGVLDDVIVAYTSNTYGVELATILQKALVLTIYIKGVDAQDALLLPLYDSDNYSTTELHDLVLGNIRQGLIDALDDVFDIEVGEDVNLSQIVKLTEGLLSLMSIELSERANTVLFSEDIENIDKVYLLLEDVTNMDISNMSAMFSGSGWGFIKIMRRLYQGTATEQQEEKEMSKDAQWIANYLYNTYPASSGVFLLDYGVDTSQGLENNFNILELLGTASYTAENIFSVFIISGQPLEQAETIIADFIAEKIADPEQQLSVKNQTMSLINQFKQDYSRRAA